MELFIMFRVLAIVLGLLIGFFSVRIYMKSKGASIGWAYMTFAGITLSFWAIIQTMLLLFLDVTALKASAGLISFILISVLIPLGFYRLCEAFGIRLSRRYNLKFIMLAYAAYWIIMLFLNIIVWKPGNLIMEAAGISHAGLVPMMLAASYPAFRIWTSTRKWMWLCMLLFTLFTAASILPGAYTSGCCNEGPETVDSACEGIRLDYAEVLPLACTPEAVGVTKYYHILLILGIVTTLAGFIGLWHRL